MVWVDRMTSLESFKFVGRHTEIDQSLDGLRGCLNVIEDGVTAPESLWHAVLAEDHIEIRVILFRPVRLVKFFVKYEVEHDFLIFAKCFLDILIHLVSKAGPVVKLVLIEKIPQ